MAEREFDHYDVRGGKRSAGFHTSLVVVPTAHEKYLWDEAVREKSGDEGELYVVLGKGL